MDIIVIGDVHIKDHKWWSDYAHVKFFEWLSKQKADHYIFTGDFFDNTTPSWRTWNKAIEWVNSLPGKKHIVRGNHEMSAIKGDILPAFQKSVPDLSVYTDVTKVNLSGYDVLFAPFLSGSRVAMVERYNQLVDTCYILVPHTSPVGKNYGHEETDFPLVTAKWKCFGHIHTPEDDIVGVPVATREGERGRKRVFGFKDGERFDIEVPQFLEYVDVDYNETIDRKDGLVINIKNAPSLREALLKFQGHWVRQEGTTLLRTDSEVETLDTEFFTADINEKFKVFAKEEGLSKEVVDVCLTMLSM